MKRPDSLPERIDGWQGLADWLFTIGIETTAAALCERARRKALPYRGGGVPGNQVRFEAADLEVWVRDLVGVDPDLWLEQRRRNAKRGEGGRGRSRGGGPRRIRAWKALRAEREQIVLLRRFEHGEEALRGRKGKVWTAASKESADNWRQPVVEAASAAVRFRRVRAATETDFHHESTGVPRASCLLAAYRMVESRLVPVPLPGAHFGLEAGVRTPAVVSPTHPRLAEIRDVVRREAPGAFWFTWEDREELDPVTLEPMRPPDERS